MKWYNILGFATIIVPLLTLLGFLMSKMSLIENMKTLGIIAGVFVIGSLSIWLVIKE